jgi:hypothetical protein
MRSTLLLMHACSLSLLAAPAITERIEPRHLAAGRMLANSTSPDGRYCLLDITKGDTTINMVILATADRTRVLAFTSVQSERTLVRPISNGVSILWAPDSKRVAVHDAAPKHSAVTIYRLAGEQFERLEINDLLSAACGKWGISGDKLISSGQRPLEWLAANTNLVMVELAGRLQDERRLRSTFGVHAPLTGKSVPQ